MLSLSHRRFLKYWSLNMTLARSGGWGWTPGFSYDDAEWERIAALAETVPGFATFIWLSATAVLFILLAALACAAIFVPLLLWTKAEDLPSFGVFIALIALIGAGSVGFGLPLAMVWGGAIADRVDPGTALPDLPGDAALYRKVRRQLTRVVVVCGGLIVPAALFWRAVSG